MQVNISVSEKRSKNYDSLGFTLGITLEMEHFDLDIINNERTKLEAQVAIWMSQRGY